ncbi:MAG: hypothetical protein ACHQHP_06480 [Bacteroidia bacterium]
MEKFILTKVNNAKDAGIFLSISKRFGKTKLLRGKQLENFYLSKMMDDAMHSETIPAEQVHRELRK